MTDRERSDEELDQLEAELWQNLDGVEELELATAGDERDPTPRYGVRAVDVHGNSLPGQPVPPDVLEAE